MPDFNDDYVYSVRTVCLQWSFTGVLTQFEWGLHFSNVPGCFLKPETVALLLKSGVVTTDMQCYMKKRVVFLFFTLVMRLRTKLMSGSLLPADTKCSVNLSGCRIR